MVSLSTVKDLTMSKFLFAAEKPISKSVPIILIVEDDADSRAMLKFLLESWNYSVIEAENGVEAVRIAEKTRPDLILLDVKLPLLDGFEAARRIRESAEIGGVPVIFLSGCAEKHYRNAGSEAGGKEYLVKPLDFEKLQNALGKYLG